MKILSFNTNIKLAGSLLIAALTLVSCKKLIEIPANPPSAITQAEQFADSATTMSAVAGVYTYNSQGPGFGYSDANLTLTTGLSSDELSYTGNTDQQQFYSYTLAPVNVEVASLWASPYKGLYQANDVLNGISGNKNLSASFIKQISAEMKVVRALYYFNMVNLFGGVPLVTSTDYNTTAYLPRAAASAIYSQVIADLNYATKNLPASYPSAGRARPNLYTAQTLLAKVNLYQGNWQAAYNEADSVINSGIYVLTNNLNNVFLDGSTEAIWQIPAVQSFFATTEGHLFVPGSGVTPTYLVTPLMLNAFDPGDQRLQDWVGTTVINKQNLYYPFKYKNVLASSTTVEGYMVFRLAEVYLIHAEAAAHLGNLSVALADINRIRKRAGLPNSTTGATSQTAVMAAVMHERQTEMCFEWGSRWFDLKRTGNAGTVLTAEKSGWQPNAALYPIPQGQRQLNSLLTQNPGYN
ncbi:RagB/SusD family nutrient uptake outer membrane protein [Mucilaginibacter paludis]|uniref:RagB/SusD domain-containing protein n=1 Tax=Mucilaginibacter paludis DSM 18603 TaxID=714943 RepID=H1Y987_9SPHI|nr:RagB/SusD family nutrient uptake outer membrane protein [Mucilaginibacter paludis]EHQ29465.1 RagB/SusD domain-containing protein [Mucilaginibacter paludis DSM 18603]